MDIVNEKKSIEIFCCYAHQDQSLLINLKKHLKLWVHQSLITIWSDTDISPGMNWEKKIAQHLNSAHIILFLVSPDFLASDYCYGTEMKHAMERYERGEVCVIPIILRACAWEEAPFGKIQALPKDAKPVVDSSWHDPDEAFTDAIRGIRKVLEELRSQSDEASEGAQPDFLHLPEKPTKLPRPRYLLWGVMSGIALVLVGSLVGILLFQTHLPTSIPNLNRASVLNLNDSGTGSLRQAILTASPASTITFNPALIGTIVLTTGELVIRQDLTIIGPGAKLLAVSGDNHSRVFRVLNAASVNISGLAIIHGTTNDYGGGITNSGDLKLTNMLVSGNTATSSAGGIYNEGSGTLTLTSSLVSENTSIEGDGGIGSGGPLTIISSTIAHNTGAYTGGIDIGLSLNMINSTVTENTATGAAGGISIGGGGGANIYYSTIYRNTGGEGGNFHTNNTATQTVRVRGSIIAGGSAQYGPDVYGTIVSFAGGYNLIQMLDDRDTHLLIDQPPHNLSGVLPEVGPLQDNGGPTPTLALLAKSPATDYIPSAVCNDVKNDQRGRVRPQGNGCDIGAYEAAPAT